MYLGRGGGATALLAPFYSATFVIFKKFLYLLISSKIILPELRVLLHALMQFKLGKLRYAYFMRMMYKCPCCMKFHQMVMYISSALNCFRSICQTSNSLCSAIYIQHRELQHCICEDSCVYWEKSVAF